MFDRYSYHCWLAFAVMLRNSFTLLTTFLTTFLLICLVSSCTNTSPRELKVDKNTDTRPSITTAALNDWLDQAEEAIQRKHLNYPTQGSAHQIYRNILRLDPNQEDAKRGLERIVETYVDLSMQALARRQFASAKSMLTRARLILPSHPSIEPSSEQIRLTMSADHQIMKLSQVDLAAETEALKSALHDFATSGDRSCRFVIYAKHDGQGRWLYQMLAKGRNQMLAKGRLRAQIVVRLPASIERLCY